MSLNKGGEGKHEKNGEIKRKRYPSLSHINQKHRGLLLISVQTLSLECNVTDTCPCGKNSPPVSSPRRGGSHSPPSAQLRAEEAGPRARLPVPRLMAVCASGTICVILTPAPCHGRPVTPAPVCPQVAAEVEAASSSRATDCGGGGGGGGVTLPLLPHCFLLTVLSSSVLYYLFSTISLSGSISSLYRSFSRPAFASSCHHCTHSVHLL